ncbi:putative reverse transcriptase domain-containing protein [Tanacetum coccineum]
MPRTTIVIHITPSSQPPSTSSRHPRCHITILATPLLPPLRHHLHAATTSTDATPTTDLPPPPSLLFFNIEPSNLGFSYEIKIASGQLVEINKVIRGCKLEIEGHIFDIDLIPFEHRSFDVIVGMDWLSRHKAEIVCHEKVVRIPLPNGEILRVLGEMPEEKVRHSKSAKVKKQKLKDIIVVRNFSEVFPDDLSGLPPSQEIEFRIDLILGAMPVAKSLYHLAPSEMEELSSQLKELQDKGFIRPSSSPWGAPHIFNQKELNMHQRRWIELFSDYDFENRYHLGKANVVTDALSRKERLKPRSVRAMNMTIQLSIKDKILVAQNEASKAVNAPVEML